MANRNDPDVSGNKLQRGTIGPIGLAALAIGILSPALGLYALWPPIQAETGPIAPLVYVCAMLLALPTAISYAVLNAQAPAAGAGSTWLWDAVSPTAGYVLGLTMATYFLMGAIAQPLLFGLFLADLFRFLGIDAGAIWPIAVSISVSTGLVVWFTRGGAGMSIRNAVILMVIESVVVIALSVTIFAAKAGAPEGISFAPFDPASATGGGNAFWRAIIIGVLAYAGFDVVSTAAEETNAPRRHLPRAILYTVIGITIFWVSNAWIYTQGSTVEDIKRFTGQGMTAVTPMATQYWGQGSIVIILTAFTGVLAIYIASVISSSRVLFALARHGLLPAFLAKLHPHHRIPINAMALVFVTVVVSAAATMLLLGNGIAGFLWWSNAMVFFFTLTFIGVNIANIFYFRRVLPERFRILPNLVVPLLGLATNLYLLYNAFFVALWFDPSGNGKSTVVACLGLLTVWVMLAGLVRIFRPALLSGPSPIGADR